MHQYLLKVLLVLSLFSIIELKATKPFMPSEQMIRGLRSQLMQNQRFDDLFLTIVYDYSEYEAIDPERKYRKHMQEYRPDQSTRKKIIRENAKLTMDQQCDRNAKRFLKHFGLYQEGPIDYSNREVMNALLTQNLYSIDRGFYEACFLNIPLHDPKYYSFLQQNFALLIGKDVPTYLHSVFQPFLLKVSEGYYMYGQTTVGENKQFVHNQCNKMRHNARQLNMGYMNRPDLTLPEMIDFMSQFKLLDMLNLCVTDQKEFGDLSVMSFAAQRIEVLLKNPGISEEDTDRARNLLSSLSVEHYALVTETPPPIRPLTGSMPFDTTFAALKNSYVREPGVNSQIHSIAFVYLRGWLRAREAKQLLPDVVHELYGMAMATIQNRILNVNEPALKVQDGDAISGMLKFYLDNLTQIEPATRKMLKAIEKHEQDIAHDFFVGAPEASKPVMGTIIDACIKRLDALRARQMYEEKYKATLNSAKDLLRTFVNAYPEFQDDVIIAVTLGMEPTEDYVGFAKIMHKFLASKNYQNLQGLIAKISQGEVRIKHQGDQYLPIDLHAIREVSEVLSAMRSTLDALAKEMDDNRADAERQALLKVNNDKQNAKFEKKRIKDEAKALKKELRAKQKAEERAKRASTQLAPSPDPSPYPSVHADLEEKRLSRAEIAEKHRGKNLKDEEKRNSKSLRQSLKDLLHIGQADEQTDKRDSKRFSRSSKRPSEIATTPAPLDLSQYGAIDRQSLKADIKDLWEGRKQLANANDQKAFVEILDGLNLATGLDEIGQSFSHGDNFEQLNSGKLKGFNYNKKDTVYSIRLRGNHAYRICFTWDGTNKKVCNVQFGDYH